MKSPPSNYKNEASTQLKLAYERRRVEIPLFHPNRVCLSGGLYC
jgi:hypothetical protein